MMAVFRADRLTRMTCRRSRSRRTRRLTSRLTPSAFSLLFGSEKSRALGLPTGIEQLDQDESCRRASGFGRHFDPPPRHLHERLGLLAFGRCRPLFDLGIHHAVSLFAASEVACSVSLASTQLQISIPRGSL